MNRAHRRALKLGSSGFLTKCFSCDEEFVFTPSIAQRGGHNHGYGKCIGCGEHQLLKIDYENKGRGLSERWPFEKPPEGE